MTPTTLVQELEQAAKLCFVAAEEYVGRGDNSKAFKAEEFATRLRARAERVRELLDLAHAQKFDGGRRELARALTGPDLPEPTIPKEPG